MIELSLEAARALNLAATGLLEPPARPATKADVRAAIRQMQALQIDSINIIARSPYLVLWSRLGSYDPRWLEELLTEGAIFEYWAHAACFLPIEDYPLYRRRMLDALPNDVWPIKWAAKWSRDHPEVLERVRSHLQHKGAVRSAEFENKNHTPGGWWNWKEEKDALEAMLFLGEVMIARRQNFQRVYDLRERVLPGWDDSRAPSTEEVRRTIVLKAVRALGVAPARWVPAYFQMSKRGIAPLLEELADAGQLLRVRVADWQEPAYVHLDNRALAEQSAAGALAPTHTTLLSPFDPLAWDRARLEELFGFVYRIETYTRAEHRRYGYYSLPILHRGAIVGRLDPKAHRQAGIFEVRQLHLEPGVAISDALVTALAETLAACAAWHQTPQVAIGISDPPPLAALVRAALGARATTMPTDGKVQSLQRGAKTPT